MKEKKFSPLSEKKDIIPILSRINIFSALSKTQLHKITKTLKKTTFTPNEFIFREGQEPSHIYIIESGKIKIIIGQESLPLEMFQFESGQCFGETSVIGIQSHSASAVAIEQTELIVLSKKALFSLFDIDKELFAMLILNIAREACRRLHSTDQALLHYVLSEQK